MKLCRSRGAGASASIPLGPGLRRGLLRPGALPSVNQDPSLCVVRMDVENRRMSSLPLPPRRSTAALLVSFGIVACLCACHGGLDRIDAQASEIMEERAHRLGGGAIAPDMDFDDESAAYEEVRSRRGLHTSKQPTTLNPSAEEMPLTVADPARDLSAILDRYTALPDNVPVYNLNEVLAIATSRSPEYMNAKEQLFSASLSLLTQRHNFGPRFFDEVSSSVSADGEGGDFAVAGSVANSFGVNQRFENGGTIGIEALVSATEQLRETVADNSAQSAEIIISAGLPLLRGAGTVAAEALISAERQMVYAARDFEDFRRNFLVDIASDYFNLVQSGTLVLNAEKDLESRLLSVQEAEELYKAERRSQIDVSEAQQRALQSRNSLANTKDNYILALERFRVRLGLNTDEFFLIDPTSSFEFPLPALDMEESVQRGLMYRLDLQNQRDQVDDTRRAVDIARNDLLPDLDLQTSVTIPTDDSLRRSGLQFEADDVNAVASLTLSLPVDRKIERIGVRQALISLERAKRDLQQAEDRTAVDIRSTVRQIELALFSLQLQDQSVRITERRIQGLRLRDDVTPRQIIDAQDDLRQSLDSRASALRDLRVSVLRYLLVTGQFRVTAGGELVTPEGLEGPSNIPSLEGSLSGDDVMAPDADPTSGPTAEPEASGAEGGGPGAPNP